jgi:hypothetical protein
VSFDLTLDDLGSWAFGGMSVNGLSNFGALTGELNASRALIDHSAAAPVGTSTPVP